MTLYQYALNGFAVFGLLVTLAIVGLIGWHAVAAYRRFRAASVRRANERAKARVQPDLRTDELDVGYESLGVIPVREEKS